MLTGKGIVTLICIQLNLIMGGVYVKRLKGKLLPALLSGVSLLLLVLWVEDDVREIKSGIENHTSWLEVFFAFAVIAVFCISSYILYRDDTDKR